jgi:putative Ca2+/H+ antiporter (TMEM165/GDT1 family)
MKLIFSGIGAIILGLTGKFVLFGTNSPLALVVAGIVFIVIGIVLELTNKNILKKINDDCSFLRGQAENKDILSETYTITISLDSTISNKNVEYEIYLNGKSIGLLKEGISLTDSTSIKRNFITSFYSKQTFAFEIQNNKNIELIFNPTDKNHVRIISGAVIAPVSKIYNGYILENGVTLINTKAKKVKLKIGLTVFFGLLTLICIIMIIHALLTNSFTEIYSQIPTIIFDTTLFIILCIILNNTIQFNKMIKNIENLLKH